MPIPLSMPTSPSSYMPSSKRDWVTADVHNIEGFLAARPATTRASRPSYGQFFSWAAHPDGAACAEPADGPGSVFARQEGLSAFSTAALIAVLADTSRITGDEHNKPVL
jgi:hypothetical protein